MALVRQLREQWGHMPGRLARLWQPQARLSRAPGAMVSFTFDDVPRSAVTVGARLLAAHGWKGTFFLAGGLEGTRTDGQQMFGREDLAALVAGGHEIACHGFGHRRLPSLPWRAIGEEVRRNRDWLGAAAGMAMAPAFAYPYGAACPRSKTAIARHFPLARGIAAGVNGRWLDFGQLRVFPMERRSFTPEGMRRAIAEARRGGGWLVVFGHDLQPHPTPWGETPCNFARMLDAVAEAALPVLPLTAAAAVARGAPLSAGPAAPASARSRAPGRG